MQKLDTIGSTSILAEEDAEYIKVCVGRLYDSGHYTKAIYLGKMVENATIVKNIVDKNNG